MPSSKPTRREFVAALIAAIPAVFTSRLLATPPALSTGAGAHFLVLGDWGRQGGHEQVEVAEQMARAARDPKIGFVVAVGDNFYENGVASATDPQWRSSFENVYRDGSLQVPWFAILGNHDYRGNCDAQIAYGKSSPRWRMPSRYYSETIALDGNSTADLFFLDTSPFVQAYAHDEKMGPDVRSQDTAKQLAWLDRSLAASKARWKICFGHHPIYSGGEHGNTPELIERLLPLLARHGVRVYFSGHDHDLQHLRTGEIDLFVSGGGAGYRETHETPRTEFAGSCAGFAAVSLRQEQMVVRLIDHHGTTVHAATIDAAKG